MIDASVVVLARNPKTLEEAKGKILAARRSEEQTVNTIAVDLGDHAALRNAMSEHNATPDMLICSVGGTTPNQIVVCAALGSASGSKSHQTLGIHCFWCAAFVALPGYAAYTPPKTAIRASADTLRQELLLYGGESMYCVHIAFPGAFITDSFIQEQATKPELLKNMEGSNYQDGEELLKNVQSADKIASKIFNGIRKRRYIITTDLATDLTLNNMRGPSPRDNALYDVFMSILGFCAFPFVRWRLDRMTVQYGLDKSLRK
ncbi:short chain dehydrogenase [Fusarium coicis]|nr:short chain dehydrogenase [Fusarium coicis]